MTLAKGEILIDIGYGFFRLFWSPTKPIRLTVLWICRLVIGR